MRKTLWGASVLLASTLVLTACPSNTNNDGGSGGGGTGGGSVGGGTGGGSVGGGTGGGSVGGGTGGGSVGGGTGGGSVGGGTGGGGDDGGTGGGSVGGGTGGGGGGSDGGTGGGGGTPDAQDTYCNNLAQARCQRMLTCGLMDATEQAECLAQLLAACEATAQESRDSASVFNVTNATNCVAAVPNYPCLNNPLAVPGSCGVGTIYTGAAAPGAVCGGNNDCVGGFCRNNGGANCATCDGYVAVGGVCNETRNAAGTVAGSLRCDPTTGFCPLGLADGGNTDGGGPRNCLDFRDAGDGCDWTTECGPYQFCNGLTVSNTSTVVNRGSCTARIALATACANQQLDDGCSDAGTCLDSICQRVPAFSRDAGSECDNNSTQCVATAFCLGLTALQADGGPSLRQGTCTTRYADGSGPCTLTTDCADGFCANDGGCVARSSADAGCIPVGAGPTQGSCKQYLICNAAGTCETYQPVGATCGAKTQCDSSYCPNGGGVCTAFDTLGAACNANAVCSTGRCFNPDGGNTNRTCGPGCFP